MIVVSFQVLKFVRVWQHICGVVGWCVAWDLKLHRGYTVKHVSRELF